MRVIVAIGQSAFRETAALYRLELTEHLGVASR
jgi:hypothetical protein